ncbi:uncharacterized protein LOC120004981 [Tripterygium wilfordii]|uniref:uncharacterized protein LOC120004981 n=1 Tax=Tripterygium wilfordii TaxID=458696 RepID=UPI0018F859F5|nr:uncharacterized protein LOC120004981 [Tripterygium wilfordii]
MSLSVRAIGNGYNFPVAHLLGFNDLPYMCVARVSSPFHFQHRIPNQHHYPGLSAVNADGNAHGVPDANDCSLNHEGSAEKSESSKHKPLTTKEILEKLRRYGISGILAYGLLNTAYYLTTFLVVWFYVAPVPAKIGYLAAAKRFLKVMAMVWAGSQVTKLVRAAGALAVAPFVDRGLSWFTVKFKFESQWKAFMAIVGFCFGLGIMVFAVVTLLWA